MTDRTNIDRSIYLKSFADVLAALMSMGGISAASIQLSSSFGFDLSSAHYRGVVALVFFAVVPAEYHMILLHAGGQHSCSEHSHGESGGSSGHSHGVCSGQLPP